MIQLVFDASDGRARRSGERRRRSATASTRAPSGPHGMTTSSSCVGDTHPVVHPADGSHANFFDEALYLGSSAKEGVGCDDTRGPTFDVQPVVQTIPSGSTAARRGLPVDRVRGPLGRVAAGLLQRADGAEPEDAVDASDQLVGGLARLGATPFREAACSARTQPTSSAAPSRTVRGRWSGSSRTRSSSASCSAGSILLVLLLLSRTAWRPSTPLRVARRRSWGQILSASARMYAARFGLFVALGVALRPDRVSRHAVAGARPARDERARGPDRPARRSGACSRCRARDRNVVDAARARARDGGDGEGARRDRRGPRGRADRRLSVGLRQRRAAVRRRS